MISTSTYSYTRVHTATHLTEVIKKHAQKDVKEGDASLPRVRKTAEAAPEPEGGEDEAFLNRAEQARVDAKYDAQEAAAHLAHRAQVNALYRP